MFLAQPVKRPVETRRFTVRDNAGFMPCHANFISNKLGASRMRFNLEHPCTMQSSRYGGATRDTIHGSLLPEGVVHRGRWCSNRTMSSYVRPDIYIPNIRLLTTQQKQLWVYIHENPYEHFNVPPPEQRDRTDRILSTVQRGRCGAGDLGLMLKL